MHDTHREFANTKPVKIGVNDDRVQMLNRPYTSGVPWSTTLLADTGETVSRQPSRRLFGNKIREAVRIIKEGR